MKTSSIDWGQTETISFFLKDLHSAYNAECLCTLCKAYQWPNVDEFDVEYNFIYEINNRRSLQ